MMNGDDGELKKPVGLGALAARGELRIRLAGIDRPQHPDPRYWPVLTPTGLI
jgi:hypothetical protein